MLAYLARLGPAGPGSSDVAFVARGDPDRARPHLDDALKADGELGCGPRGRPDRRKPSIYPVLR
jgi:hypothetical protein